MGFAIIIICVVWGTLGLLGLFLEWLVFRETLTPALLKPLTWINCMSGGPFIFLIGILDWITEIQK